MNHEESVIQAGICRTLQEAGVFFFSIPNEGAGDDRRRQMTMMAMGLRPGVADLCVWWPKEDGLVTIGFLEVKTRNGRQSTSQRKFEMLCRIRGVPYSVVRSVEDVEVMLAGLKARIGTWPDFRKEMRDVDNEARKV